MPISIFAIDKKPNKDSKPTFIQNCHLLQESSRRTLAAQKILTDLHEKNKELRCQCIPTKPARMFLRFTHGYYTIVNHPTDGGHSEQCELFTVINGYSERDNETTKTIVNESQTVSEFMLHRRINGTNATPITKVTPSNGSQNSAKREDKLSKLAKQLLKASFSDWYYKDKGTHPYKSFKRLSEAATNVTFGDYKLSDWMFFGKKGFGFATEKLANHANNWRGTGRPHALLVVITDSVRFDKSVMYTSDGKFSFKSKIQEGRGTHGSSLILASVAYCEQRKAYCCHKVYVKPIVSTEIIMPVDSSYEREVALKVIAKIDSATKMKWSLQKPIFYKSDVTNSVAVLPDFILQSKNGKKAIIFREIIEVMGMLNDPDYVERKSRTMPLMPETWSANSLCEVDTTDKLSYAAFIKRIDNTIV